MGERRRSRKHWAGLWAGKTALLLSTVGCSTDSARDLHRDDPILGASARNSSQPAAVATATPIGPPPPAYAPQPPLTPATPTSNTAVAGGFQPLTGGSDLRMGSGGAASTNAQPGVQPVSGGSQGVTAVPPPNANWNSPQPVPTSVNPPPPPQRNSLEAAYAAVAARNPLWHRLKFNGQTREYTFEMSVPSKMNTAMQRTVEATASAPIDAIQRALEQLE